MTIAKNWLALYTRPKWEKKVAKLLDSKRVENYCPLNRVVRNWADRKKTIHEPLFTSYVFVHASEAEYADIKATCGVVNFVHWLGKPAVIKRSEIDSLKKFLNEYTDVGLEKIEVNVNDEVKIIYGPLASREGKVIEVQHNAVKIMLPSLGYCLNAQVHRAHIEKISPAFTAANYFDSRPAQLIHS